MKLALLGMLAAALMCSPCSFGEEYSREANSSRPGKGKLFWWSVAAMAAASVADIQSSVNKYEQNPMLRTNSGAFSIGRGAAAKAAMMGAILGCEQLLYHGGRPLPRAVSIINFAAAGVTGATAMRNHRVPTMSDVSTPAYMLRSPRALNR